MREYLFRGKRADNGEWVKGYFEKYNGRTYINLQTERLNTGGYPIRDFVEVEKETVGQYTGLTDKQGKKVFEGDILQNTPRYVYAGKYEFVVEFKDGEYFGDYASEFLTLSPCDFKHCEIIGNIHDNPELLKKGGQRK